MPKYKKNINYIVTKEDVEAMLERAQLKRDKFIIAALYLTGARPAELLELRHDDITVSGDVVSIKLQTKKLGQSEGFRIRERILEIPIQTVFVNHIINWWERKEGKLLEMSLARIRQIVYALSDNKICPYNFRHSRMVKLMNAGASSSELMYWKGAESLKSVEPYIRGKPIGRRLIIE